MKKVVSIILPIYKIKEEYLKECIESLKNQTYKGFEVICIFDGSPVETIEFAKNVIGGDLKFKIFSRDNKGVSYTRNEGILKSSCEWITFIDADDWLEKNAIELFVDTIESNNDIDFCMFKAYINNIENYCKYNYEHIIDDEKKFELFQSTFGSKHGKYSYCESVWKNFYRKSAIVENNIMFPEKIKIGEDMLFNYDVWLKCKNGYFINKPIYNYRVNDESVMNADFHTVKEKYETLFPVFEKKMNCINKKYTVNSSNYIIKQIKRFFLKYGSEGKNFNEVKNMLNSGVYRDSIKKSKIFSFNFKNSIFLFLLKTKNFFLIKKIIKMYNR